MATALDLITRAMRLIGQLEGDEDPSPDESADGLLSLNEMIESMSNEEQFVYQIVTDTFSWPSSQASRTIGSGGNFNTDRPIRLDDGSFLRVSGNDYPLKIITDQDYAGISQKTASSDVPWGLYGDRAYPLMNLYLVSVPSATVELHLASWKLLQSFTGLTTAIALPPGYTRMVRFNLALELAGEYGVEPPSEVRRIAAKSRAILLNTNEKNERMDFPRYMPGLSPYRANILTGE